MCVEREVGTQRMCIEREVARAKKVRDGHGQRKCVEREVDTAKESALGARWTRAKKVR
jgi:SH3-like domain-containing protein